MKFTAVLSIMTLTSCVLVAALPASVTNVARFSAPFISTSDNQIFCEWGNAQSNYGDTGGSYARRADCEALANVWRSRRGYWDVTNWNTAAAEEIGAAGTCHLRISRPDGGVGEVWIGNQDVGNFIGQATNFAHGGEMGVLGIISCSHPSGDSVVVALSVMS